MSENKIIIDGIDVSECDFFIDWYNVDESKFQDVQLKKILVTDLPKYLIGVPLYYLRQNLCDCYSCYCEENPNCYFKQLKRKEQERSTSNKYAIGFARKCQRLELDIFHLKDENNKLKRKEQKLEKIKELSKEYKVEYTVNNGVQLLTNKILQIIEGKENE